MMKDFEKIYLTPKERVKSIKSALDWLSLTVIPVHHENGNWVEEQHPFWSRYECFLSGVDTAIRGYMWSWKLEGQKK